MLQLKLLLAPDFHDNVVRSEPLEIAILSRIKERATQSRYSVPENQ